MLQLPTDNARTPATSGPRARRPSIDPIFLLIEKRVALKAEQFANEEKLEECSNAAASRLGSRPFALIAWRNYSHIGGSEIEGCRDVFLHQPGADHQKVLAEYRDAKSRYGEAIRREIEWDKAAGLSSLRKKQREIFKALSECEQMIGRTEPRTLDGAAALLRHLFADELCTEVGWHVSAIKNVMTALEVISHR